MRKLNIHFRLPDEAIGYCRHVNAAVREITSSLIVFRDDSPMIPHVTLAMGELDDTTTLIDRFLLHASDLAGTISPTRFLLPRPYLEDVVHSYVFSDVDGGVSFLDTRARMIEDLTGGWLADVGGSYGSQPPHLTLAHVSDRRDEVRVFLSNLLEGPAFLSTEVEVSDVGPKGTCVNSLAVFRVHG